MEVSPGGPGFVESAWHQSFTVTRSSDFILGSLYYYRVKKQKYLCLSVDTGPEKDLRSTGVTGGCHLPPVGASAHDGRAVHSAFSFVIMFM